jgi:N-acetylmuramoyl-L-alanine amidase
MRTRPSSPIVARVLAAAAACAALGGCSDDHGTGADAAPSGSHHARLSHEPQLTEPGTWPNTLPVETGFDGAPPLGRPTVVFLDAGHGAKDNPGNTSSYCVEEQDFTAGLALDVADELTRSGRFDVVLSREGDRKVAYADRVGAAATHGADAFISLHSDVRGKTESWSPRPDTACLRSFDAPGFSVLYSDEGPAELVDRRVLLGRGIAAEMRDAGWVAYGGAEYVGLYQGIGEGTGLFVDRHEPQKRIFVLRRTTMPAVIVETHNALDPREADAWEDPTTRRAFAFALGRGIEDGLRAAGNRQAP